jgi:hypothetical protein
VLLASHLLAEVVQTADRVLIIARGRALREADVASLDGAVELAARGAAERVRGNSNPRHCAHVPEVAPVTRGVRPAEEPPTCLFHPSARGRTGYLERPRDHPRPRAIAVPAGPTAETARPRRGADLVLVI